MIYPKLPAKFLGVTCFETDPWALPIGVSEDQGWVPFQKNESIISKPVFFGQPRVHKLSSENLIT